MTKIALSRHSMALTLDSALGEQCLPNLTLVIKKDLQCSCQGPLYRKVIQLSKAHGPLHLCNRLPVSVRSQVSATLSSARPADYFGQRGRTPSESALRAI